MNLLQVIHQRWAAASALNDLLPASRVTTGAGVDSALPLAVISKQAARPLERFSDGSTVDEIVLRVEVFHDDHDAGSAVTHQVKVAFDRTSFDLADGDEVLNMERANDFAGQQDDGRQDGGQWRFVIDFRCIVHLATGV